MLLVFGSINLDIAFDADHLPGAGETVLGRGYRISPGGKGANQAHAARRDGMPTQMAGAIGEDGFAASALAGLGQAGVDLSLVQRLPGQTGCAGIVVDARGENQIVVAPGVNLALKASHVSDAALARVDTVLLQMETDPAETAAMAARARRHGCRVILNNAPARPLPREVLDSLDVLIVNAGELTTTAQAQGVVVGGPDAQAVALATAHRFTVVVTLGANGVLACGPGAGSLRLPAIPVNVVDTTGAGDTFAGVFAAAQTAGLPLQQALARASVAASLSCTRNGAQASQPHRDEIDLALRRWPS